MSGQRSLLLSSRDRTPPQLSLVSILWRPQPALYSLDHNTVVTNSEPPQKHNRAMDGARPRAVNEFALHAACAQHRFFFLASISACTPCCCWRSPCCAALRESEPARHRPNVHKHEASRPHDVELGGCDSPACMAIRLRHPNSDWVHLTAPCKARHRLSDRADVTGLPCTIAPCASAAAAATASRRGGGAQC